MMAACFPHQIQTEQRIKMHTYAQHSHLVHAVIIRFLRSIARDAALRQQRFFRKLFYLDPVQIHEFGKRFMESMRKFSQHP